MLKVEQIILTGFAGMELHEIKVFDMSLRSDITIILGGNGCGKTSLLSVFFPVAPSKAEFVDGGGYVNISQCGDHRYKFEVWLRGSSLHCSITNLDTDEVIVDRVNPKVYNARVEEITGITKELKELLNGEVTFSRSNTEQRRKWLTRMSSSDLEYALNFYKNLRKLHNQNNGAILHVTKQVAESKTRVIEEESERNMLADRIVEMENKTAEYDKMLSCLPPTDTRVTLRSISDAMQGISKEMTAVLEAAVLPNATDVSRLETERQKWICVVNTHRSTVTTYNKELSLLLDEENRRSYLLSNHKGLKEQIDLLTVELAEKRKAVQVWPDLTDSDVFNIPMLENARKDVNSWSVKISMELDNYVTSKPLRVVEDEILASSAKLAGVAEILGNLKSKLSRLEHDRTHFLDTKEVSCPQCDYIFRPGVNDSLENIERSINEVCARIRQAEEEQAALGRDREPLEQDCVAKRAVRDLLMAYSRDPVVSVFFKHLAANRVFAENRDRFGSFTHQFVDELENAINIRRLEFKLDKSKAEWKEAVSLVKNIDSGLEEKIARVRTELNDSTEQLSVAEARVSALDKELTQARDLFNATILAEKETQRIEEMIEIFGNNELARVINISRNRHLDLYAVTRDRYRQMEGELQNLNRQEKELGELVEKQRNLKLMITAWSPDKGYLKRHIYNAIVRITEMMNTFINDVWQYRMDVLPCDTTDGDLDYTFPVAMKARVRPTPDVSKGSRAQKKMFDLAFRLTAYKAHKLIGYPLLLDEPSDGMDEEHRHELVSFIKKLSNSGDFSQLIVVSHESDVHSKLTDADYCVIEPSGVTLPAVYNEHVKISYAE